jgi:hypothetical protein
MAIAKARYAKTGTTAIAGVTHAAWGFKPTAIQESGGAGIPGRKASLVTSYDLTVSLFGEDLLALLAQVGKTKANITIGYADGAGVLKKCVLKNVVFTDVIRAGDIPRRDEGGKVASFGILGHGCWLSTDTVALMRVVSGDG